MNYNIREQILSCPTGGSNPPQRWYPGFDYSDNINQLRGISRNVDYATLLNEFVSKINLHAASHWRKFVLIPIMEYINKIFYRAYFLIVWVFSRKQILPTFGLR